MTAVIGIMNKSAVTLAADSAVTVGGQNGNKIFNKANKIFALSKKHPVGIALYNSAMFMGVPWETIIKMYRNELKDKSFSTINDYKADFINYITKKKVFSTLSQQQIAITNLTKMTIHGIFNTTFHAIHSREPNAVIDYLKAHAEQLHAASVKPIKGFEGYTLEEFKKEYPKLLHEYNQVDINGLIYPLDNQLKEIVTQKTFENLICSQFENAGAFTGLVFAGFGEEEIYPKLSSIKIADIISNRVRMTDGEGSGANFPAVQPACIFPFAQKDVIDTILQGIDPQMEIFYANHFEQLLNQYNSIIFRTIGKEAPEAVNKIKSLNITNLKASFRMMNRQLKLERNVKPLIDAVSYLGKEDLAEMAESLIYLTYLKRRITFAEESVGGPVDVALISKGDGFVWIKRKHYFREDLNKHFITNYL